MAASENKSNKNAVRVGQNINTRIIQSNETTAFKVPNTAIAQNEENPLFSSVVRMVLTSVRNSHR